MMAFVRASVTPCICGGLMNRLTRALVATLAAAPLVVCAIAPAAQAATKFPGGPGQTPVMGWSGWSFLRLGAGSAPGGGGSPGAGEHGPGRSGLPVRQH